MSENHIKTIKNFFRDKHVEKAYLFGSFARGNANIESDVDLLIEPSEDFNFLKFQMQLEELEVILRRKVDAITTGSLRPDRLFSEKVLKERVAIYER